MELPRWKRGWLWMWESVVEEEVVPTALGLCGRWWNHFFSVQF